MAPLRWIPSDGWDFPPTSNLSWLLLLFLTETNAFLCFSVRDKPAWHGRPQHAMSPLWLSAHMGPPPVSCLFTPESKHAACHTLWFVCCSGWPPTESLWISINKLICWGLPGTILNTLLLTQVRSNHVVEAVFSTLQCTWLKLTRYNN